MKPVKIEHPMKNKNIRYLWWGQMVSELGDSFHSTALGFYILALTGSSSLLGLVEAFLLIPRIFLSMVAGVAADRYDRKKIIIYTDLIRGIILLIFGVLAITGLIKIWMILLLTFILGATAPFFEPALQSIKPDLVKKDQLLKTNALFQFSSTGIWTVGRALGGILVQYVGAPLLILFNGISFMLSGFSEQLIEVPPHHHNVSQKSFLSDIKEGFRYAYKMKGLRVQYTFILFLNFMSKIGMILTIPFFAYHFDKGPSLYASIMVISTLGFMTGSKLVTHFHFVRFKRATVYVLLMVGVGLTKAVYPLTENLFLIGLSFFISGTMIAIANIIGSTVLQVRIERQMRGKVYGFRRTMNTALLPLGALLGGVLGEVFSLDWIIMIAYMSCAVIGGSLAFSKSHRQFFNYEEVHDGISVNGQ